jgi:hypothetical protein
MNDSRFKLPDEAVQLASGKLLIAGGSKDVEVFDPASGKFVVALGQLDQPWYFMTETKLSDGSGFSGRVAEWSRSNRADLDLPAMSRALVVSG